MKRLNFLAATSFALFFAFQVFQSCECQKVDCDSGYFSVQFLSKADDSDLFENGTYQRSDLRFFVMYTSATSEYSHWLHNWQNDPTFQHEPLSINIERDAIGYIFQFNSTERDTLGIAFTMSEGSECCAGIPVTTFGFFKGDTIFPNASGTLILKK
jgi:hypothetical protein